MKTTPKINNNLRTIDHQVTIPCCRKRPHADVSPPGDREKSLRASLAMIFGQEWIALSPADRTLIVRDVTDDGTADHGLDLAEYRRNIGPGNLQSYARVMRVRFAR